MNKTLKQIIQEEVLQNKEAKAIATELSEDIARQLKDTLDNKSLNELDYLLVIEKIGIYLPKYLMALKKNLISQN